MAGELMTWRVVRVATEWSQCDSGREAHEIRQRRETSERDVRTNSCFSPIYFFFLFCASCPRPFPPRKVSIGTLCVGVV